MAKLKYLKDIKEPVGYQEKRFYVEEDFTDVDLTEHFKGLFPDKIPDGYTVLRYLPAKIVCRKFQDCTPITGVEVETKE